MKSALGAAFRLDLPTKLGIIHPAFHFSQFKTHQKSKQNQEVLETRTHLDLQLEHKTIETILAKRTHNG